MSCESGSNNGIHGDDDVFNAVVDNYQHPLPQVIYTPWNIPGIGVDLDEFESQLIAGCECKDGVCKLENACSCVSKYGRNYDDNGCLLEVKFDGPVVECNSTCACFEHEKCGNRVVQFGPLESLQVFSIGNNNRGLGLKPNVRVEKGSFICEYAGEVIGLQEAKLRVQAQGPEDMNYVFVLNEHLSNGRIIRTCIDPTAIGNIGRYINHSCEPNSSIVPVRVETLTPKLCVFACRLLEAGEEITFHYGGGEDGDLTSESNRKSCLCGAKECKQYLPLNSALM